MSNPARHPAYRERMRIAWAQAKLAVGCAGCGWAEHPDALEFDHIDGTGGGHAHHLRQKNRSLIYLKELMMDPNVQVLCGNCHNIKSRQQQRRGVPFSWEAGAVRVPMARGRRMTGEPEYTVEWERVLVPGERLTCTGLDPRTLTARIIGAIRNSGPIIIHGVTRDR